MKNPFTEEDFRLFWTMIGGAITFALVLVLFFGIVLGGAALFGWMLGIPWVA